MQRSERVGLLSLAAGWILFLFVAFPGQFTRDSLDQLAEARGGPISDAHPPLMAVIWRFVDMVVPGTFGMLVLQSGLLLAGLYLVFRRATSPRAAAAFALAIFWFPPVNAPMMVIWKDSLMAGACMLGFALLLDERRRYWGIALLCFGCALRYNGLALAFPLILLLFHVGRRGRYAIAVATWLAIVVLNLAIGSVLTERKTHYWSSSLGMFDLAGTLCFDDRRYSDAELEALLAGTDLRIHSNIEAEMCAQFGSTSLVRLVHRDRGIWHAPASGTATTPEPRRIGVERAWKQVVLARPRAYLAYRLSVFYRLLSVTARPWGMVTPSTSVVTRSDAAAELGLYVRDSAIQAAWIRANTWLAESTPLFRPWLYLLVALGVLVAARRQREIVALLLSGVAMELSLFVLTVSPDYRYSHWLVLATCVSATLVRARDRRT